MNSSPQTLSSPPIFLGASLSNHRRERIFKTTVGAQPSPNIPKEAGLCLLFGSDFQSASAEMQTEWVEWTQKNGRVLLLIPPFKSSTCTLPTEWSVQRRQTPPAKKAKGFIQALSSEVRFQLEGQLQIPTQLEGQWDDQTLCTVFYRQHPHSGVFAITCLPLWSLVVLDWVPALRQWLSDLYGLAELGESAIALDLEAAVFVPVSPHFTVLLHLLTAKFQSSEAVLASLNASTLFSLDSVQAAQSLQDLEAHGLVSNAALTEPGYQLLLQSQYAPYAEELEALAR